MNITVKTLSYYCLLTLWCLVLYLPGITSLPLTDRDSAHFAQASRQMVLSHNFWDIRFQNKPRHLKPPGIYWLHSASVHLFSSGESHEIWPYTLISVIGGTLAVLLTFAFARRTYSTATAFLASTLLAASPLLMIESHLIVTDSVLLATVVIMQGSLWQIYIQHRTLNANTDHSQCRGFVLLFWLGMSAGILIKGIAPLFAVLTIFGLCIADRNITWCKHTKPYWGIPLVLLLTAAWLIPLSFHTNSNFLLDMLTQDALPKITGGQQSHGMPPGFFTVLFTLLFWPGALFLWRTINWSYHHRNQPDVRFLLAWIIPAWIFIELTPTKLPEYSLPLFPAVAMLSALTLTSTSDQLKRLWNWLARLQYGLWVFTGFLLISCMIIASYHFADVLSPSLLISILLASVVLVLMMFMALLAIYRNRLIPATIHAMIGIAFFFGIVFQFILPQWHYLWVTENVVNTLQTKLPLNEINADHPLLTVGYAEPSLVFRLGASNVIAASSSSAVDKIRQLPIRVIIVEQKELPTFKHFLRHTAIHLKIIEKMTGFNYSKGRWVTLIVYERIK